MKLKEKMMKLKEKKDWIEKKMKSLTIHMISEFPIRMPSLLVEKGMNIGLAIYFLHILLFSYLTFNLVLLP
jgi:hypothetical protein